MSPVLWELVFGPYEWAQLVAQQLIRLCIASGHLGSSRIHLNACVD